MTQHLNVKPIFLGTHILEKNPYIYIYSIHTIRITISYYLILECYTCCLLISCNDNSNTIILIASHINNNNNNNSNNKHHKKKTNIKHNNTNIYI